MPKFEVTGNSVTIGPSVELAEYKWLKVSVTVSFQGDVERGMKEAELLYWQVVAKELKLRTEIEKAYTEGQMKALRRLTEAKIEKIEASWKYPLQKKGNHE